MNIFKSKELKNMYLKAYIKMKEYDKKAKNPFLSDEYIYNPFKSIYEQTYLWVSNPFEK